MNTSEWQPFETAPKDGSVFLGGADAIAFPIQWQKDPSNIEVEGFVDLTEATYFVTAALPTHWRPMPLGPDDSTLQSEDHPERDVETLQRTISELQSVIRSPDVALEAATKAYADVFGLDAWDQSLPQIAGEFRRAYMEAARL